jgi:hypothetical protein
VNWGDVSFTDYDQDPGLRSADDVGSFLVLAVRAGATRAVDHQASEERAGEDGDEELLRTSARLFQQHVE